MPSQSKKTALDSETMEERRIFGFGPDHSMPYSCSHCLGTPRKVKECRACKGTGLMWDPSLGSIYQGKEKRQMASGGSSSSPGSSSLSSSYSQRR
ncbi:hypothetical protein GGR54DRAFT_491683 [Hypoxylon sp. NC1633]|nr:hypothetical protein GGR54DRAFT_491683 [Hypoxylon sp. NC1633]